jgi:uncharacterized integral membrane protein
MAYQEEEARKSRVVVQTPHTTRQVTETESVRYPEKEGVSGGVLAAIVVGVVALAAIVVFFVMNRQQENANLNANQAQQPQTIVQQPAQQPPIIVQQPAPAGQQAPVIINQQPAPAAGGSSSTSSGSDDYAIQAAVDKKFRDDPNLSSLGVTTTVVGGTATITGMVKTEALKAQVERAVRNVKGVKSVDNQLIVG